MYNGILEQDLKWRKSVIYDMDETEGHLELDMEQQSGSK